MELFQEFNGGFDEVFATAGRATGADGFVVSFSVAATVGNVADAAVGEFGDQSLFEGREFFDGEAEFDKDFAGQADPGEVVANADDLDFDFERFAFASGDVEDLVSFDELHEVFARFVVPGADGDARFGNFGWGDWWKGELNFFSFDAERSGFDFVEIFFGEENAGGEDGSEAFGFSAGGLLAGPIDIDVI